MIPLTSPSLPPSLSLSLPLSLSAFVHLNAVGVSTGGSHARPGYSPWPSSQAAEKASERDRETLKSLKEQRYAAA